MFGQDCRKIKLLALLPLKSHSMGNNHSFLTEDQPQLLEDILLIHKLCMIFQQDGAPFYRTHIVTHFLNTHFLQLWIGYNKTLISWPLRSPDLTPLNFFMWGWVESLVYRTNIDSKEQLHKRIVATFNAIRADEKTRCPETSPILSCVVVQNCFDI